MKSIYKHFGSMFNCRNENGGDLQPIWCPMGYPWGGPRTVLVAGLQFAYERGPPGGRQSFDVLEGPITEMAPSRQYFWWCTGCRLGRRPPFHARVDRKSVMSRWFDRRKNRHIGGYKASTPGGQSAGVFK